jgi:hypothetical protein
MSDSKVEQHGVWWLPTAPGTRVRGVLRAPKDGPFILELTGALGDVEAPGHDLPEGHYRILGTTDSDRAVVLENCYASATSGWVNDLPSQRWQVHEIVFDAVFDAVEPWAFFAADFQMPGLTAWLPSGGVESFHERDEAGKVERMGVALHTMRLPLWATEAASLELVRRGGIHDASETITEVESRIDLAVRASGPMEASDLRRLARPLQMLMGLATGVFTTVTAGAARLSANASDQYAPWKWQPIANPSFSIMQGYGFLHSHWKTACEGRLPEWLQRLDQIDPVLDLYLASLREASYAELSFLILVQALETYHRRTATASILPAAEWDKLRSCLNEAVNEFALMREGSSAWQSNILDKVRYLNEPSLPHRLQGLFAQVEGLAEVIAGGPVKKFSRQVTDTRNYFTHYDPSKQTHALRGASMVFASSRLQALLEVLLLRDAGFDFKSEAVVAILRRRVEWLPK